MMKRQFSYTICAAAMLLAACAKTDAPQPAPETGAQLSIAIFDGGYAPVGGVRPAASNASEPGTAAEGAFKAPATRAAGTPVTRAAENGYATQFTVGDRCGLYIVRDGTVTAANVRLTASEGSGGAVVWTPDASAGTLWFTPGDRYFVYYPWQAAPQGAPTAGQTVDAADDGAFFAALIAAWSPAADQSDYVAGYSPSDLMTAEASVGSSSGGSVPLLFAMSHRMALAVVELPETVYTFTNEGIADYTVPVAAAFGGEAQPCRMADRTYRYLVNPDATLPTLEGSYDNGSREFSITPAGIAGGSYKTYKVDGGTVTKQHTLQVGDYFLSDGHLLAKGADAATVQAAEVVGIVFQTDPERIGEAEKEVLAAKGVTAPHGLVMAVKNAGTGMKWGTKGPDEGLTNCVTKEENNNDISGYGNCEHIRQIHGGFSDYLAFKAADDYNTTCPAPASTTGWYLPASGQWYDLLCNLGGLADWDAAQNNDNNYYWSDQGDVPAALNKWMEAISAADKNLFTTGYWFWSSSEYSGNYARGWRVYSGGNVRCYWSNKNLKDGVRTVLAF